MLNIRKREAKLIITAAYLSLPGKEFNYIQSKRRIRSQLTAIRKLISESFITSENLLLLFPKYVEPVTDFSRVILPIPDPACYLTPNECWAGKGSAGKNRSSDI